MRTSTATAFDLYFVSQFMRRRRDVLEAAGVTLRPAPVGARGVYFCAILRDYPEYELLNWGYSGARWRDMLDDQYQRPSYQNLVYLTPYLKTYWMPVCRV